MVKVCDTGIIFLLLCSVVSNISLYSSDELLMYIHLTSLQDFKKPGFFKSPFCWVFWVLVLLFFCEVTAMMSLIGRLLM